MKRQIDKYLLDWKLNPSRKVLLIRGARQVGKTYSVRELALQFGKLLERRVHFTGAEVGTALLGNTGRLREQLGEPTMPDEAVMRWTAHWIQSQGRLYGKPTHFEVRDGRY